MYDASPHLSFGRHHVPSSRVLLCAWMSAAKPDSDTYLRPCEHKTRHAVAAPTPCCASRASLSLRCNRLLLKWKVLLVWVSLLPVARVSRLSAWTPTPCQAGLPDDGSRNGVPDCNMHNTYCAPLLCALLLMPAAGKLAARVDRTLVVGMCELLIL